MRKVSAELHELHWQRKVVPVLVVECGYGFFRGILAEYHLCRGTADHVEKDKCKDDYPERRGDNLYESAYDVF